MFKAMIEHYSPLITSIKTMFGYKSSSFLGASVFSAISIETISQLFFHGKFLQVPILLLVIVSGFILVDWIFGSAASRKISLDAKAKGDTLTETEYKFKSIKVSHTIFKFLALYLWLVLSLAITNYAISITWLAPIVEGITIVPILLFGFREFISIGEAIEILYGYKPFLFSMGEKIFDALQFKFLKRLKE